MLAFQFIWCWQPIIHQKRYFCLISLISILMFVICYRHQKELVMTAICCFMLTNDDDKWSVMLHNTRTWLCMMSYGSFTLYLCNNFCKSYEMMPDMMWTASCHGQPILNKNPIIKMQQATAHLWNYVFGATIPSITAGSLILKPTAWNVFFRVQCRNLKIGNVSILYLKFFLFIFMLQHKNGHFEHYYAP